jgi:hypothetical protein
MNNNTTTTKASTAPDKPAQINWDQFCWNAANAAAREWFRLQSQNPLAAFYLYFKPGALGVFTEKPAGGWLLGSGARLNPAHTRQQVASWINDVSRRLPFLPV